MLEEKVAKIGHRIKVLRTTKGIMQTELAEKIGVSQTNMSNIETGRTSATLVNLFKIKDVLNCKMADFFTECDAEEVAEIPLQNFSMEELQEAAKLLQMLRKR